MKFVLLSMISVVMIGTGNVTQHLFQAFSKKNSVQIVQVIGRNANSLKQFPVATSTHFNEIVDADIYLLAVSDDAISKISGRLTHKKGIVTHTSGSISINDLQPNKRTAVFYPLQTFTKGKKVDFKKIPICIEAKEKNDLEVLKKIASELSDKVEEITSEQRKALHLAAVFANNFTNHLYHISKNICEENEVSFDLLRPLIQETVNKIANLPPKEAQTGPAKRNDSLTMNTHLEQLKEPFFKEIYQIISESIRMTNDDF